MKFITQTPFDTCIRYLVIYEGTCIQTSISVSARLLPPAQYSSLERNGTAILFHIQYAEESSPLDRWRESDLSNLSQMHIDVLGLA